jgi:hypothetical protein
MKYLCLSLIGLFLLAVAIGMAIEWYVGKGER